MSNRVISSVTKSIVAVGLFVGTLAGCGSSGSGSSGSIAASCMKGCMTAVPCLADAGFPETISTCVQECEANAKSADGGTCTNEAQIDQAGEACAAKTNCTELEACFEALPACQTTGGTGGTSGAGNTGGASSTGGTSGGSTGGTSGGSTGGTSGGAGSGGGTTADCSVCTKAATCCTAVGEPSTVCNMISASTCNAATGATQTALIQDCQSVLTGGAQLGNAACQ